MATDYHGYPVPLGTVKPFVHLDIKNLADAVDKDIPIVVASAAARDALVPILNLKCMVANMQYSMFIYNGTAWVGAGNPSAILLSKNAQNVSGTSNAWTDMLWEIEDFKSPDITHAANSATVEVQTAGVYDIKAKIAVNTSGLAQGIVININGTNNNKTITQQTSAAGEFGKVSTNHDLLLAAGDDIKICGRVNSTSPIWDGATCSFSITRKLIL